MKYSIIINPYSENSDAVLYAQNFIQSVIKKKHQVVCVFFYGYAVEYAFINDKNWKFLADKNISLFACSTIAENFHDKNPLSYFKLQGLGQWMQAVLNSDKTVEFT